MSQPESQPPPISAARPQPAPLRIPVTRPRWAWVFLGVNLIVWLLMTASGGSNNTRVLIEFGANYAPRVVEGEYWRLLTANFLHIGIIHLLFNSFALYTLGPEAEALFGSPRFVVIYLLGGLSGSILSFGLSPEAVVSAGASTSLFGLVGALLAYFVRNRRHFGSTGRRRIQNYIFLAAVNLIYGLSTTGIDNLGHIGGFFGGLILGWLLCPFYKVEGVGMERRVVDLNSLRGEWLGVVLFALLLVVGVIGGISRWLSF